MSANILFNAVGGRVVLQGLHNHMPSHSVRQQPNSPQASADSPQATCRLELRESTANNTLHYTTRMMATKNETLQTGCQKAAAACLHTSSAHGQEESRQQSCLPCLHEMLRRKHSHTPPGLLTHIASRNVKHKP